MILQILTSAVIGKVLGGLGIMSGVGGIFGRRKANKQREEFTELAEERAGEVSEGVSNATTIAQENANSVRMAGQDIAEDNIKAQGASNLGVAKQSASSGDQVLQAMTDINQTQMTAFSDLQLEAEKSYQQRQAVLMNQMNLMGQYQDASERDYLALGLGQAGAMGNRGVSGINNGLNAVAGAGNILGLDEYGQPVAERTKNRNGFSGLTNLFKKKNPYNTGVSGFNNSSLYDFNF